MAGEQSGQDQVGTTEMHTTIAGGRDVRREGEMAPSGPGTDGNDDGHDAGPVASNGLAPYGSTTNAQEQGETNVDSSNGLFAGYNGSNNFEDGDTELPPPYFHGSERKGKTSGAPAYGSEPSSSPAGSPERVRTSNTGGGTSLYTRAGTPMGSQRAGSTSPMRLRSSLSHTNNYSSSSSTNQCSSDGMAATFRNLGLSNSSGMDSNEEEEEPVEEPSLLDHPVARRAYNAFKCGRTDLLDPSIFIIPDVVVLQLKLDATEVRLRGIGNSFFNGQSKTKNSQPSTPQLGGPSSTYSSSVVDSETSPTGDNLAGEGPSNGAPNNVNNEYEISSGHNIISGTLSMECRTMLKNLGFVNILLKIRGIEKTCSKESMVCSLSSPVLNASSILWTPTDEELRTKNTKKDLQFQIKIPHTCPPSFYSRRTGACIEYYVETIFQRRITPLGSEFIPAAINTTIFKAKKNFVVSRAPTKTELRSRILNENNVILGYLCGGQLEYSIKGDRMILIRAIRKEQVDEDNENMEVHVDHTLADENMSRTNGSVVASRRGSLIQPPVPPYIQGNGHRRGYMPNFDIVPPVFTESPYTHVNLAWEDGTRRPISSVSSRSSTHESFNHSNLDVNSFGEEGDVVEDILPSYPKVVPPGAKKRNQRNHIYIPDVPYSYGSGRRYETNEGSVPGSPRNSGTATSSGTTTPQTSSIDDTSVASAAAAPASSISNWFSYIRNGGGISSGLFSMGTNGNDNAANGGSSPTLSRRVSHNTGGGMMPPRRPPTPKAAPAAAASGILMPDDELCLLLSEDKEFLNSPFVFKPSRQLEIETVQMIAPEIVIKSVNNSVKLPPASPLRPAHKSSPQLGDLVNVNGRKGSITSLSNRYNSHNTNHAPHQLSSFGSTSNLSNGSSPNGGPTTIPHQQFSSPTLESGYGQPSSNHTISNRGSLGYLNRSTGSSGSLQNRRNGSQSRLVNPIRSSDSFTYTGVAKRPSYPHLGSTSTGYMSSNSGGGIHTSSGPPRISPSGASLHGLYHNTTSSGTPSGNSSGGMIGARPPNPNSIHSFNGGLSATNLGLMKKSTDTLDNMGSDESLQMATDLSSGRSAGFYYEDTDEEDDSDDDGEKPGNESHKKGEPKNQTSEDRNENSAGKTENTNGYNNPHSYVAGSKPFGHGGNKYSGSKPNFGMDPEMEDGFHIDESGTEEEEEVDFVNLNQQVGAYSRSNYGGKSSGNEGDFQESGELSRKHSEGSFSHYSSHSSDGAASMGNQQALLASIYNNANLQQQNNSQQLPPPQQPQHIPNAQFAKPRPSPQRSNGGMGQIQRRPRSMSPAVSIPGLPNGSSSTIPSSLPTTTTVYNSAGVPVGIISNQAVSSGASTQPSQGTGLFGFGNAEFASPVREMASSPVGSVTGNTVTDDGDGSLSRNNSFINMTSSTWFPHNRSNSSSSAQLQQLYMKEMMNSPNGAWAEPGITKTTAAGNMTNQTPMASGRRKVTANDIVEINYELHRVCVFKSISTQQKTSEKNNSVFKRLFDNLKFPKPSIATQSITPLIGNGGADFNDNNGESQLSGRSNSGSNLFQPSYYGVHRNDSPDILVTVNNNESGESAPSSIVLDEIGRENTQDDLVTATAALLTSKVSNSANMNDGDGGDVATLPSNKPISEIAEEIIGNSSMVLSPTGILPEGYNSAYIAGIQNPNAGGSLSSLYAPLSAPTSPLMSTDMNDGSHANYGNQGRTSPYESPSTPNGTDKRNTSHSRRSSLNNSVGSSSRNNSFSGIFGIGSSTGSMGGMSNAGGNSNSNAGAGNKQKNTGYSLYNTGSSNRTGNNNKRSSSTNAGGGPGTPVPGQGGISSFWGSSRNSGNSSPSQQFSTAYGAPYASAAAGGGTSSNNQSSSRGLTISTGNHTLLGPGAPTSAALATAGSTSAGGRTTPGTLPAPNVKDNGTNVSTIVEEQRISAVFTAPFAEGFSTKLAIELNTDGTGRLTHSGVDQEYRPKIKDASNGAGGNVGTLRGSFVDESAEVAGKANGQVPQSERSAQDGQDDSPNNDQSNNFPRPGSLPTSIIQDTHGEWIQVRHKLVITVVYRDGSIETLNLPVVVASEY